MNVRAPLIEAQIPETYLLSAISFETIIATKAARIVHEAQGREVVEFGTRRAHSPEAGCLGRALLTSAAAPVPAMRWRIQIWHTGDGNCGAFLDHGL